ncbi:alpha/beta hydrolase family protein [Apilactobacillus apinorum]|uniref:alpha/beta hydrolase family protein n=1 Tax=Apilactobacillus apinorum TaxID=1218495 RepID=UPI0006B42B6F|nr:S9 family peptidase [Apilactobacillus apinorum]KOY68419.1 Dipeptidyl aminopeptidase/acylaminoacyl-peptidase [Apilactobacillus apinorum]CAI2687860.1 Dipeptidyl aminopeptidase/acylaminoacyl-peptidase [Apilactobacillus apinorum]
MSKKIKATDLFQLKSVTQVSNINGQIFAVLNRVDEGDNEYYSDIISINQNNEIIKWTDGGKNTSPIAVGNYLVYVHNGDLMRMPLDGGSAQQLTQDQKISKIVSGKDNQTVFYQGTNSKVPAKFKTSQFPDTRHVRRFDNRHDGIGWVDDEADNLIYRFNVKLNQGNQVYSSKYDLSLQDGDAKHNHLLVIKQTNPTLKTKSDHTEAVYEIDLTKDTETNITKAISNGIFSFATYAPNNEEIVVAGNDYQFPNATVNALYSYKVSADKLVKLSQEESEVFGSITGDFIQNPGKHFVWKDNGEAVFTTTWHGHSQVWQKAGDTLTKVYEGHCHIVDLTVIDDQIFLDVSTPEVPSQLVQLLGQQLVVKYDPNENFSTQHEYADVTPFSTPSKDGKATVEGWVLKYTGSSNHLPVILYVHGGPQANYGETFFHEFQALASRGYAIVYVNPRGSTSYGQDFESAVIGHYGDEDYDDVLSGLDAALTQFADLDNQNTFIAGGSYGGFMSGWAVGHTNRFNAAIVQRPVSDWHSLYGTSDIGVRFIRTELGMDLYDEGGLEYYWDRSPLKYAPNVKTPTRIQHGEWDMRCPVNQSEALFTAIKQTGTDVDYIRYPQSFHGFSRNGLPSLRMKRFKDIYEWFDKYLK